MLGLFGLIGALGAGLVIDGLFAKDNTAHSDAEDPDREAEDQGHADRPDMLDLIRDPADDAAERSPQQDLHRDGASGQDFEPETRQAAGATKPDAIRLGTLRDDRIGGGEGDDSIKGLQGDDQIVGRGGHDTLDGGRGADRLEGERGNDLLLGRDGDDELRGGDGHDSLRGGKGHDLLAGENGADRLFGAAGHDSLMGGSGQDTLYGGAGNDWLQGGYGDDLLYGGAGKDTLDGDFGNDTLVGHVPGRIEDETDFLNGGAGNDLLVLGNGDIGTGGAGADRFQLGDWLTEGSGAYIADFDARQDELEVIYDAKAHPDPVLTLHKIANSPDVELHLDGMRLATLANGGGIDLSTIRLTAA
ncbi:calcium-binding protein [Gemmobacter serpentinus]|uniref:calcium-binding protein n=1 Tax=Gemmobacter serpentinus TaxID=2652247 RepID=UPI00124DA43E|nr:calcium-binding protein [Gemmobacter serpentinus]